jgi:hypothetical protein
MRIQKARAIPGSGCRADQGSRLSEHTRPLPPSQKEASGDHGEMKALKYADMVKLPGFIAPPGARKRPKVSKVTIKEKDLQAMAEDLAFALGIRFFRIPDKLLSFLAFAAPAWTRIFVARYFAGVPDLMLFRPIKEGKNEVLFVEIKTEAGKLSQSQKKWHSCLNVHVTYGWDATEKVIRDFAFSHINGNPIKENHETENH